MLRSHPDRQGQCRPISGDDRRRPQARGAREEMARAMDKSEFFERGGAAI